MDDDVLFASFLAVVTFILGILLGAALALPSEDEKPLHFPCPITDVRDHPSDYNVYVRGDVCYIDVTGDFYNVVPTPDNN